jgi:hypothetical protein
MNAEQANLYVMDLMFGVKRGPHIRNKAPMARPILLGLEKRGAVFTPVFDTQLWYQENGHPQWFKMRFKHPMIQGPNGRQRGCFEVIKMTDGRTDGPVIKRFFTQQEADAFAINPVF